VGFGVRFLVLGSVGPVTLVVAGDLAEVEGSTIVVSSVGVAEDPNCTGASSRFCQYDRGIGVTSVAGAVAVVETASIGFGMAVPGSNSLLLLVGAR
jgi:hypothetical protein